MGKVKKALAFAGKLLLYYAAIPFIACLVGVVFYFGLLDFVVVPAAILLIYIFIRWKKLLDILVVLKGTADIEPAVVHGLRMTQDRQSDQQKRDFAS